MQVRLVPMRAQRDSEEVKVLADNLLRVHHILQATLQSVVNLLCNKPHNQTVFDDAARRIRHLRHLSIYHRPENTC